MSLAWIKVCAALLVLAVGLAGAVLPWGSRLLRPTDRMLALGDTFAGGVLGGAGLIHLLGGGIAAFRAAEPHLAYPVAQVLAGAGFLLVLLIEGVIVADRPVPGHRGHGSAPARHEVGSSPPKIVPPYAFILLIVLAVHSVILGVALGAQQSLRSVTIVLLAIIAHKGVAGFALGVSYQRSGQSRTRALPSIALFAAMTPAGILAGTAVSALLSTHAGLLFEAVFDSVGAGTFIYIAALDITRTEFDTPEDRWPKWVCATAGFAAMAVLAIWLLPSPRPRQVPARTPRHSTRAAAGTVRRP